MRRFFYFIIKRKLNCFSPKIINIVTLTNHFKTMGLSSFFSNLFGSAKETAVDFADQAENTFEEVKEASEPIIDSAAEYLEHTKDAVSEYVEKASDSIHDVIDSIKEVITETANEDYKLVTETVVDVSEDAVTDSDSEEEK